MRWNNNFAKHAVAMTITALAALVTLGAPAESGAASKSARTLYEEAHAAEQRLTGSQKLQADKSAWFKVARRYHQVVLAYPRSGYCDDALYYEGEIYRQADERFRDRDAVRRALDAYLLLVNGYPSSKWCPMARLARVELYLDRLANEKAALYDLNELLAEWPKSKEAAEAKRIHARMNGTKGNGPAPNRSSTMAAVRNIRHWTGKEYTRIVIDMDHEVAFHKGRLTEPDRIYFDLLGTKLSQTLGPGTFPIGDGFLKQYRVAQNKPGVVRVVLDFESISRYNVFSLHDPFRLVVDILGIKPETEAPVATEKARSSLSAGDIGGSRTLDTSSSSAGAPTDGSLPPLPPEPTSDGRFPLSRQLGLAARRVIIDPGHGGRDPGTTSPTGLREKDLVLDISHRLANLLEEDGTFEILMTREKDIYIPLEERTAIANSQDADLFISIHANASPNRRVRGIETYFLNLATSPEAEQTAARENAVSTRRMGELREILLQIVNNSRIAESGDFAKRVQGAMVEKLLNRGSQYDLGVKTAPFYVLLGANMPSVLVEVSFLSNQEDARLLATDTYRQSIAKSIYQGIRSYSSSLKKVARARGVRPGR